MKIFFVFLFITTIVATGYTQWQKLPVGTDSDLFDLYFITPDLGWVVGKGSTILKTIDGGNTWIAQQSQIHGDYSAVFFVDENSGWVGGYHGILFKTSDGGENWVPQNSKTSLNIASIYFTDKKHGYAALYNFENRRSGLILQTSDGGENWTDENQINGCGLIDVFFQDENTGWAVGTGGKLLRTNDKGKFWYTVNANTPFWLHSIYFYDETGWIVGGSYNQDVVLKSTDNGKNWFKIRSSKQNTVLTGAHFVSENVGWVCGVDGVILRTENGGISWMRERTNTLYNIQELFFNGNTGYAVGEKGTILKYYYDGHSKPLNLYSPCCTENWKVGSAQLIKWESFGIIDVKIEYSYNNGASWNNIEQSYPSTGVYQWKVPNIISTQAKVRISDKNNPKIFFESDCFTISN